MQFVEKSIENYCVEYSQKIPSYLMELERVTHQRTLAPQMLSGGLMGRYLSFISKMIQPECIVEIGTFTGYSALCLAEGLTENGQLHTFEVNEELKGIILEYQEKSPYQKNIHLHIGLGEVLLPKMDLKPDLAFIDAGKMNYEEHYEIILKKMQPGGIILVDNVLWSGKVLDTAQDQDTKALQAFNKRIARDDRCTQVMIPLRDGLTMLRKI